MIKRFTPLKVSAPVRSRPELSTEEIRRDQSVLREGLSKSVDSPTLTAFARELFGVLDRAAGDCTETRHGRCWPRPRIEAVRSLVEQYDAETCRRAAKEAREIVQAQDRAPNITALFAKKCADIEAERDSVRDEIRKVLAA